jgi:hypothetical protein
MSTEYNRATADVPPESRQRWMLRGSQALREQELFDFLLNTPGHDLRLLPRLSIFQNEVIDAGGVFRDSINRLFGSMYNSDMFSQSSHNTKSFRERSPTEFVYYRSRYYVFGKIFYWFIIIHRQVPYPMDLNPAIVAYAIHEKIPQSILLQVDPSVHTLIQQILGYSSRTSVNAIVENVREWLSIIGVPLSDFMSDLCHPQKGPKHLADTIATLAVVNNSFQAFSSFRDGFNDNRGFETV